MARLLSGESAAGIVAGRAFMEANPNMEEFLRTPSTALFVVDVEEYAVVQGYGAAEMWRPLPEELAHGGGGVARL